MKSESHEKTLLNNGNEETKVPLSEKERKSAQRARDKAKAEGTYEATPFLKAKDFLNALPSPDF